MLGNRFLPVTVFAFLLSACAGPVLENSEYNEETHRFVTEHAVEASEIEVSVSSDADKFRPLLLIRSNLRDTEKRDAYLNTSFSKIAFFDQVMVQESFEQFLVQEGYASQVQSVEGYTGLANAQSIIGDFLVIDFHFELEGKYLFFGEMKVVDPSNAETLLVVRRSTGKLAADNVMFKPLFNAFLDWLEENSRTWP